MACPRGTTVEGDKCIREEVMTVVKCPSGSHFEQGQCLGNINTDCPQGMLFKSGTGCVPVIATIDPAPSVPPGLTAGGKCPAGMVHVQGGSFKLGGYHASAGSTVSVKEYCIDLNEVTVGDYKLCSQKGKCPTSQLTCNPGSSSFSAGDDQLPLNCIDYTDSSAYCSFVGKRLPTEDEWEWAARGGSLGRKYPWGDTEDWTKLCASTPNKRTLPCRVGSFPSGDTPLGIHDMAGGLWEWTTTTRPQDNLQPGNHAIRGGGWDIMIGFPSFASGSRVGYEVTYRSKAVGFRCAKNP
ncbi:MAG: SUMF1/EgtB/PvdO family nonheme iron enzyme [Polyangiaceae bacterium]|nr:SUMF1/EgtB/PvdO family nonheme iron enzyme [Polyangiaceae bacterium]